MTRCLQRSTDGGTAAGQGCYIAYGEYLYAATCGRLMTRPMGLDEDACEDI